MLVLNNTIFSLLIKAVPLIFDDENTIILLLCY